jgi:DNA-binding NarL/FixJ family response regulator
MPIVKIVVVDDHDLLRAGVRDYLSSMPEYRMVGEASSARAGLQIVETQKPDIVLMDIAMPGMDGIVATREVHRRMRSARVIMLSAHRQLHDVRDAFNAGVVGYVLKSDPPETLKQALETVVRGGSFVSPAVAASLATADARRATDDVLDVLSEREREIFRLAADCRTSPEIARALCLARKTVDTHLNRINRKLGLRDRAELVRLAASIGLVHSIRTHVPAPVNGVGAHL